MTTGEILSVSDLNKTARTLLEEGIGSIWIQGEISNFSTPSSGHWYFSLKDQGAQIRCAMFAHKNRQLNFVPKHGEHVLAFAQVSLYEARGEFQLIVEKLEAVGDGKLQFELEQLTRKLAAEGLFDAKHKKPLPEHPACIGIITSPTGAAIRDILHVLKRRAPNIPIIIYPTAVQGAQAAPQIVEAIQIANARKECDVLIIARGGGSLEDLWPFNEEIVARAIFASVIPMMSGVGHEVDLTICDSVADMRAPTPSAAAELVSPDMREFQVQLEKIQQRLAYHIQQKCRFEQQTLNFLRERLKHPKEYWQQLSQHLDFQELKLKQFMTATWQEKQQALKLSIQSLNNLNPLSVLARGYAIAMDSEQKPLASVKQFTPSMQFYLRLKDGEISAIVK